MANRCVRAYLGLLSPLNHFQFVALHRKGGSCHQNLVRDKEREGLYKIVGSQDSKSSWEGLGEAMNHQKSTGRTGNFSSSPSFPVHLLSLNPSHPSSLPSPPSCKDPCRTLKEALFFIPHPAVAPQGLGTWLERAAEEALEILEEFSSFLSGAEAGCCCSRSPAVAQELLCHHLPPAVATLITIKLAVLEEVRTRGQSCPPLLRGDAGNH